MREESRSTSRNQESRPARRRVSTGFARRSDFPWLTWLIRGGVALLLLLTGIALFAPHGTWLVGCVLMAIGSILVPLAYFAGAYGAFSEDSLYGLLYLLIPSLRGVLPGHSLGRSLDLDHLCDRGRWPGPARDRADSLGG